MPYKRHPIMSRPSGGSSTRATPAWQTHLTPEQRFAKHKSGKKAGKYVFRYGLHLVPAMYDHINPVESRERAEESEMHLTNYLRLHGYWVWSN